jgi:hypothetical protein
MLALALPAFSQAAAPRVFLLDGKQLQTVKDRIHGGDASYTKSLAVLIRDADEALGAEPLTVVNKDVAPPSGDKHDYMSQAPYFWPNPDTPDGLPYIRRDGRRNPDIKKIPDHGNLGKIRDNVETLALAYYFSGDEKYAAKASELLRVWFLDPATRMNPNLQFAQAVPGINTGRGTGIIETAGLTAVVDSIELLAGSKAWTQSDQQGMEKWFDEYLKWLLESRPGRQEAAAKNNHGTYYDMQVASFALFLGKKDLAATVLNDAKTKHIAVQIEPDGRQPLELARTNSWGYSLMNLRGLMSLARLAENVDIDLWNYQTADGRGIRKALDYLLPFAFGREKWQYEQIGRWSPNGAYALLRRAAIKYPDQPYQDLLPKLPELSAESRENLLRPKL